MDEHKEGTYGSAPSQTSHPAGELAEAPSEGFSTEDASAWDGPSPSGLPDIQDGLLQPDAEGVDDLPLTGDATPFATLSDRTEEDDLDEGRPHVLSQAAGSAVAAASAAGREIAAGFAAVRDVRAAARQHSTARSELRSLQADLDETQEMLDHRLQIEEEYESIVAEETAELDDAERMRSLAIERIASLGAERDELSHRLASLRSANEERLRPFKNLMDSTKGRADDASVALADARRAVRSAESQLSDATRKRDQRISTANRAVDNATERLRKVQAELDKLQADPNASPTALPKLRDEVVSERAHLDAARADVDKVTAECKQLVESAQTHLWEQRQTLEAARTQADDAKREATSAREEYDALYKDAKAAEEQLEGEVSRLTSLIDDTKEEQDAAQERIDSAQAILDEAHDIHDTPEVTAELAAQVREAKAEIERRHEELRDIAQSEKHLRASTRSTRVKFFVAIGIGVALVLFLVWFIFFRPSKADGSQPQTPVATSTSQDAGTSQGTGTATPQAGGEESAAGKEGQDQAASTGAETQDEATTSTAAEDKGYTVSGQSTSSEGEDDLD